MKAKDWNLDIFVPGKKYSLIEFEIFFPKTIQSQRKKNLFFMLQTILVPFEQRNIKKSSCECLRPAITENPTYEFCLNIWGHEYYHIFGNTSILQYFRGICCVCFPKQYQFSVSNASCVRTLLGIVFDLLFFKCTFWVSPKTFKRFFRMYTFPWKIKIFVNCYWEI